MSSSVKLENISSIASNGSGRIDVPADFNLTGTAPVPVYRINGVPLSFSQTPWTSNHDAANYSLNNVSAIGIGRTAVGGAYAPFISQTSGPGTVLIQVRNMDATISSAAGFRAYANNRQAEFTQAEDLSGGGATGGGPGFGCLISANIVTFRTGLPIAQERMRIATNGSIGIGLGTADPAYRLDVNGDINISAGSVYRIDGVPIGSPAGANTQIQFNNNGVFGASTFLVWDNSNRRLGVGVGSPIFTLEVQGDASVTNLAANTGIAIGTWPVPANRRLVVQTTGMHQSVQISDTSSAVNPGLVVLNDMNRAAVIGVGGSAATGTRQNTAYIGAAGAATDTDLSLEANGERVRITAAGNVGIGNTAAILPSVTTAPQLMLGSTTAAVGGEFTICVNTGPTHIGNMSFANYAISATEKRVAIVHGQSDVTIDSGVLSFYTMNAGTVAEHMRITATGNVGIGTANPGAVLHVAGGHMILTCPVAFAVDAIQNNQFSVAQSADNAALVFYVRGSDGAIRTGNVALA